MVLSIFFFGWFFGQNMRVSTELCFVRTAVPCLQHEGTFYVMLCLIVDEYVNKSEYILFHTHVFS